MAYGNKYICGAFGWSMYVLGGKRKDKQLKSKSSSPMDTSNISRAANALKYLRIRS